MKKYIKTSLVLGITFQISFLSFNASAENAKEDVRKKIKIEFVNEKGVKKNGTMNLSIDYYSDGTASIRDETAINGERYPIFVHTGPFGKSYFFWRYGYNNQTLLCNKIGYAYGATDSVTSRFPLDLTLRISEFGISSDSSIPTATKPEEIPQPHTSLSIVKCCNIQPCTDSGE